jgi:uncharacterized protein (DUF58 family)
MRGRDDKPKLKVRRRLQVGPGGMMFLVVTALILAVAIWSQAPLLFWAFGLMVGALGVSLVLAPLMLRHVEVSRVMPSHGVAGEPMVLRYELLNRKRFFPAFGVVVSETWGKGTRGWRKSGPVAEKPRRLKGRPSGWVLHLGNQQKVQAEATCWPMRRGHLKFERIVLHTAFPFGIIRRVVEFEQAGQVLVYPHLYRMNRRVLHRLSDADPHGRKKLERAGGYEEFFGLREYRPGDSLKMIDWKRSARTGNLVSKEMTQPSPPKVMVVLDLSQPPEVTPESERKSRREAVDDEKPDATERAISLTASIVCDAHFNGYQVGLAVLGVPCTAFPVHHSLPHRTKMLEALSQIDLSLRAMEPQPLPAMPSVVVRPSGGSSGGGAGPGGGAMMIMGADQMEQHVVEMEGGADAVLSRRAVPRSKREAIKEEAALWG